MYSNRAFYIGDEYPGTIMFAYTNFVSKTEAEATARLPRTQNPVRSKRDSPSSVPKRPPSRPAPSHGDSSVSERNTKRVATRAPVPSIRFQRALEKAREERTPSPAKGVVQPTHQRPRSKEKPAVCRSQCDVIKRWPLEAQCHVHPHSSYQSTPPKVDERKQTSTEHSDVESDTLEEKIILAVREALREKEGINEHEQRHDGGVEANNIRSKMDTKTSSDMPARESRPLAGIIRKGMRDNSKMRIESTYKKIFNNVELDPPKKEPTEKVSDEKNIVYMVLPDPDYPGLNLIMKKNAYKLKNACGKEEEESTIKSKSTRTPDRKMSKQDSRKGSTCTFSTEVVGDCNASEDTKLQQYIEDLVRSMKINQPDGEPHEAEDEGEGEHMVCKSFCICRVCVSNKTPPKRTLLDEKQPKKSQLKFVDRHKSNNFIVANASKSRQTRLFKRELYDDSHFRVLEKNQNFQPDSRMSITPQQMVDILRDPTDSGSIIFLNDGVLKAIEDMYLQRRMGKSGVKRRMSTI